MRTRLRWTIGFGVVVLAAQPHAALPATQPAVSVLVVPAGATVNVRLTQPIEVDAAQAGMSFAARVDDPVAVDGHIAIPREARAVVQAVRVEQSGAFKGSDKISLKLSSVTFGGRTYQVATEYATASGSGEGKRTSRKVAGGVGLGALIGGIAGGGDGAAVGAIVGGIGGTAIAASGQEHLQLPAETRLQFKLTMAVRVQP